MFRVEFLRWGNVRAPARRPGTLAGEAQPTAQKRELWLCRLLTGRYQKSQHWCKATSARTCQPAQTFLAREA